MKLTLNDRVASGQFADLIAIESGTRLVKVFRSWDKSSRNQGTRFLCKLKSAAYDIAQNDPVLRECVPRYFGPMTCTSISTADGEDVSAAYLLDSNYVIERITPVADEQKFGMLRTSEHWSFLGPVAARMEEVGIRSWADASVLNFRNPTGFRIIDFKLSEVRLD